MTRLLAWIDQIPDNAEPQFPNLTTPFSSPQADGPQSSAKQIFQNYLRNHPLPNTFAQQKQIAQLKILETQEGSKPWINFVQAGFSHGSKSWQGEDWRLRIGIEFPLFDRRNTLQDAALAEQNLSRAQLEAHLLEARLQISEKLTNLQFQVAHLNETQNLTTEIIQQVQETLQKDEEAPAPTLQPATRYRLKRGLHRIQSEYLDAQYAYQTTKLELDYFSIGEEK
jgi:outer membrane protein TolC